MAIFYLRTSIVRSSSGKSAVASAAYQSATSLHDKKLGRTFSYKNKEEVIHTEILLPENAPADYQNRETLWNAVEKKENKSNSRYARQFVVAVPREWGVEQAIERSRDFIQEAFVNKGMAVDWAFHMKSDNPHLHIMCTVRGFTKDGTWATMEKKAYALDENGQRIPEIDPKTGEQKIRKRTRNGTISEERLWKRITIQSNDWNKRTFLCETKRLWAEHCNRYLSAENKIDDRSYQERGILKLPQIHEGPGAREALGRGVVFDSVQENQKRKRINQILDNAKLFIHNTRQTLRDLKDRLLIWRARYEQERCSGTSRVIAGNGGLDSGLSDVHPGIANRTRTVQKIKEDAQLLEQRTVEIRKKHRHRR